MTVVLPVDSTTYENMFYYWITSRFLSQLVLISDAHGGVQVHSSSILAVKHFIPKFVFTFLSAHGLLYSGGTPRAVLHPKWWPTRSITCILTYLEDALCRVRFFYGHLLPYPRLCPDTCTCKSQVLGSIARGTNFVSCRFQTS